jgi:hypothetical protein
MKKTLYSILFLIFGHFVSYSQTGEIQGRVIDDKGQPVMAAAVQIITDKEGLKPTSKGAKTDANGFYTIKGLSSGKFNVMARFTGKGKDFEYDVEVYPGRPSTVNFQLGAKANTISGITVTTSRPKNTTKIDVFKPVSSTVSAEQIKDNSVRDVNSLVAASAGVVQADRGQDINVAGDRSGGNVYFVDGVKMSGGTPNIPPSAIQNVEVMVTGVPAKYGDATGGVISITTKGPPNEFRGNIEGLTSQMLDPFGYNVISGSIGGPILKKRGDTIGGKPTKGETILGYYLNAQYESNGDGSPRINGNYKLRDNVFNDLIRTPYRLDQTGTRIIQSQEFIRGSDIEETNSTQNTSNSNIGLVGKIDWKLNENGTNLTFQGRYGTSRSNDFISRYQLVNSENNPVSTSNSYSGFVRLYQPLFKQNSDKQANSMIRNANLTIQADYEKTQNTQSSPLAGDNPWNYGYIGKFDEIYSKNVVSERSVKKIFYGDGANDYLDFLNLNIINGLTATDIDYTPGTINPTAANFTREFINLFRTLPSTQNVTIADIDNQGALVNGKRAETDIHGLFFPMARIFNGNSKQNNDQFRLSGNINFDIVNRKSSTLNKHTIEMGFEAEQRIRRNYAISPNGLWALANTSINQHLAVTPERNYNPLLIMNNGADSMRLQDYVKQLASPDAKYFGQFDTVFYDREVSNGQQTNFSKNLRRQLGFDSISRINIHSLTPNQLNLNMFSADELINSSIQPDMSGYDVYGNQLSSSTTFQDFFTQKSNGQNTRAVAAFTPIYVAGYIQDRFQLKDMAFNVGLRADFYDPMTYSFNDPYTPAGSRTIADVTNLGAHPSNLPQNAVVYVNTEGLNPSSITGYRLGNQWYSAAGKEVNGVTSISTLSGGKAIPFLQGNTPEERQKRDMKSEQFDPNLVFSRTNAIFNLMPRLNFSFKIDTNSLVFANFDILTQRPGNNLINAQDYYNLIVRSSGNALNNPNLQSPRTTNLGIGFQQRLSVRSKLTINFQYNERENYIQITRLDGAYPQSYLTYANTDFGTVKSLSASYDLARTNNLRLGLRYMMQFAEGTGSSATSQLGLINANQGNLRIISPLDFDSRHNIDGNINYTFPGGRDYNGPRKLKWLLQDFGVNVTSFLRSGTPYTQQSNIIGTAFRSNTDRAITLGDINSARLPWRFNMNLKFNKDFVFKVGSKVKDSLAIDSRKSVELNMYLQINNLFNNQIVGVYRFTGSPEEDGYIGSPVYNTLYSEKAQVSAEYAESFRDMYRIALNIPNNGRASNFALPRIIQLGAILSF